MSQDVSPDNEFAFEKGKFMTRIREETPRIRKSFQAWRMEMEEYRLSSTEIKFNDDFLSSIEEERITKEGFFGRRGSKCDWKEMMMGDFQEPLSRKTFSKEERSSTSSPFSSCIWQETWMQWFCVHICSQSAPDRLTSSSLLIMTLDNSWTPTVCPSSSYTGNVSGKELPLFSLSLPIFPSLLLLVMTFHS